MSGQGGASAYLAILVLFNIPYNHLPPIALSCNIAATLGIIYHFRKAGHFKWHLIIPFIITSVPAAFIGGTLTIPEKEFKIILIAVLAIAAIKIFFWEEKSERIKKPETKIVYIVGSLIGLLLGLLSGMIGIGGGVFLLPIIIFLRWGNTKESAAAAGMFTLVNSISGLAGHGTKGGVDWHLLIPLIFIVVVGSQIGAHIGAKKISANAIQKIFGAIMMVVSVRLLLTII